MKWSLFEFRTIYGTDRDGTWNKYQTLLSVGRLRLHIFHRGDADPDPHDHMWDFHTLPLTGYLEVVYDPPRRAQGVLSVVRAWRLHHRPAEYAHRVLGRYRPLRDKHSERERWEMTPGPIITLVWVSRKKREWGFWVKNKKGDERRFVPWRTYIYGPEDHDVTG